MFAGHIPRARTRHWTPAQLSECGVWISGSSPVTLDSAKIATVQNLAQPRNRIFETIAQDATKNSLVNNFNLVGNRALYARQIGGSARLGPATFASTLPQTLSIYSLLWVVDPGTNYIWDGASAAGNNILATAGAAGPTLTLQATAVNTISTATLPISNPSVVRVNDAVYNGAIFLNRSAQVIGVMGTELMDGLSVFTNAANVSGRAAMTDLVLVKTQLSPKNDAKLTNWMRDKSALTRPFLTMFFSGDSLTQGQEAYAKPGGWRAHLCDVLMARPVGGKWIFPTGGQTYQYFLGDLHNAVGGAPTNDFMPDPGITTASVSLTINATAKTITRVDAGSFITDGFYVGLKVKGVGFTNGGNNAIVSASQVAYVTSVTASVLTIDNAASLVNETATAQIKSTVSTFYPGTQSGTSGTYGTQDIIWHMAGTNDARNLRTAYVDPNGLSSAYARHQAIITDILTKNPTASLIVSTLPNINPTGNASWAANIADFNSRLPGIWSAVETATGRTLHRVDLASIPYDPALWADDVHFNDRGYFQAFKLIYPAVEAAAAAQAGRLIDWGLDTSGIANDFGGFQTYGSVAGYWNLDEWGSDLTKVSGNAVSVVNRANRGFGDWSITAAPPFSASSWSSGTPHPGITFNGTTQAIAADALASGATGTDTSWTLILAVDISSFSLGDYLFAISGEDANYDTLYVCCQPSTDATKVRIGRRGDSPGALVQLTSTNSWVTGRSIIGISFGLVAGTPKISMRQLHAGGEVALFAGVTCNAAQPVSSLTRWRLMASRGGTNQMPGVVKAAAWLPGTKVDDTTLSAMLAAMRDNCGCPLT